jgi:hypothetical protein
MRGLGDRQRLEAWQVSTGGMYGGLYDIARRA